MAKKITIALLIILGLAIRIWLVPKFVVGDFLSYMDWGKGVWDYGIRNLYFGKIAWEHSGPNYPPLSVLLFAALDWLWQHKYVLAQMHNVIKIPPSFFIIYFYKYGNLLLFKLPVILADLGISIIIYKLVLKLTKSANKAILGMTLYFLNPITIFVSGAWGQTDSLVALFGIISFLLLLRKKIPLAVLTFFIGVNFKPSWGIFFPFFIYLIFLAKPKIKDIAISAGLVIVSYFLIYWPFAGDNIFSFSRDLLFGRLILPTGVGGKASNSAFDFYTIFLKIDRDFYDARILGILPAYWVGYISLIATNYFAYTLTKSKKDMYVRVFSGLVIIGLGYFFFGVNMLERYFFMALIPLIILAVYNMRSLIESVVLCLLFFANIIWSFFRRGSDEVDHLFTDYGFALIKVISLVEIFIYLRLSKRLLDEKN